MARTACVLFLRLAVKNDHLDLDEARDVARRLAAAERAGRRRKARHVCVERGLVDARTARELKRHVRAYLAKKARRERAARSAPPSSNAPPKSGGAGLRTRAV